jgi:hypothetical protein
MIFVLSLLLGQARLYAQSREATPEPNTPTVAETMKYIEDNTSMYLKFDGTSMTSQDAVSKNYRTVDVLDIWEVITDGNMVDVACFSNQRCVRVTTNAANDPKPDLPSVGGIAISTQDKEMAERVARAMGHLVRLLRQQNHPANDPFAKPQ